MSSVQSSIRDSTHKPDEPHEAARPEEMELNNAPPAPTPLSSGPPSLEYDLRSRKWAIVIFWGLVVFDSTAMPIALYFGLWYGTSLSPNTVFSIVTAALGGVSIVEYFVRFWRLFKKGSTCRVIGGRRAYV